MLRMMLRSGVLIGGHHNGVKSSAVWLRVVNVEGLYARWRWVCIRWRGSLTTLKYTTEDILMEKTFLLNIKPRDIGLAEVEVNAIMMTKFTMATKFMARSKSTEDRLHNDNTLVVDESRIDDVKV